MSLRLWTYRKCGTCRKAEAFLTERMIAFERAEIRETPPGIAELREMLAHFHGDWTRLFNRSGVDYRELNLKNVLPQLTLDETLTLLASNGNLIRRPFALGNNCGTVGFKSEEWTKIFA